jgi:hypothetical protein
MSLTDYQLNSVHVSLPKENEDDGYSLKKDPHNIYHYMALCV